MSRAAFWSFSLADQIEQQQQNKSKSISKSKTKSIDSQMEDPQLSQAAIDKTRHSTREGRGVASDC